MGRTRAICVATDPEVRRAAAAALEGAGLAVDQRAEVGVVDDEVAVIVVDRATRQRAGAALCGACAPVVVVADDLSDDALITLMLEAPVSHAVGDPATRDLTITSEKLASGDVFGLEKYVAPAARVGERVVTTDTQKRAAIAEICAWAEGIGARRPVLHRIASVADELLMNALIDAPREAGGGAARAVLRWASDDRTIAISVGDAFGALRQRDVIDHVRRARCDHGRPTANEPGAGLGLYLVLANVASLVVNVARGVKTEVVCVFDRARADERRAIRSGLRSLHVFAT